MTKDVIPAKITKSPSNKLKDTKSLSKQNNSPTKQ